MSGFCFFGSHVLDCTFFLLHRVLHSISISTLASLPSRYGNEDVLRLISFFTNDSPTISNLKKEKKNSKNHTTPHTQTQPHQTKPNNHKMAHSSCPSCGASIQGETKTCNSCGKTCPV
ncbi:hypothetical protein VTN00DRAFT_4930 [Thermoascus crustaceus]|uniref:uncharacterized protein n=1 Tax=Thermoascus crustaceus TaxID=5088 RepID=UPI003743F1B3